MAELTTMEAVVGFLTPAVLFVLMLALHVVFPALRVDGYSHPNTAPAQHRLNVGLVLLVASLPAGSSREARTTIREYSSSSENASTIAAAPPSTGPLWDDYRARTKRRLIRACTEAMRTAASWIAAAGVLLGATVAWPEDSSESQVRGPATTTVELHGTVLDADGEPLDDFHLTVFRRNSDSEVFRFRRATGILEAQTDTSAYAVAIDAAGHARWFGGFRFRSGGSHDFGNVRLASERVLTGRVLDSATAVAIAGAAIEYIPPTTSR